MQGENCEDNFNVVLSSLSLPPRISDLVKVTFDCSAFLDIFIRISHVVVTLYLVTC